MTDEQLVYIKAMAAAGPKKRRQTPLGSPEPNGSKKPNTAATAPQVKAPSTPSVPIGTDGKAPAIEQPMNTAEVCREAQALQRDLLAAGMSVTAGDCVDHVLARRRGSLSTQQVAREAVIERSRAKIRGTAISLAEAVRRVSQR